MKKMSMLGGVVLAASLATPVLAMPVISVESVSGVWSDAEGGSYVNYIDGGKAVRWGGGQRCSKRLPF